MRTTSSYPLNLALIWKYEKQIQIAMTQLRVVVFCLHKYSNVIKTFAFINQMVYDILSINWRCCMTTAEMIKELCEQMNISISELARRIGQTPQNFSKKLKRETVSLGELKAIADVLGIKFEQAFILPDGNEIKTGNE